MLEKATQNTVLSVIWLVAHVFVSMYDIRRHSSPLADYGGRFTMFDFVRTFVSSNFTTGRLCDDVEMIPFIFLIWCRRATWWRRNRFTRWEINASNFSIQSIGVDYQFIIFGRVEKFICGRWVGWWMASFDFGRRSWVRGVLLLREKSKKNLIYSQDRIDSKTEDFWSWGKSINKIVVARETRKWGKIIFNFHSKLLAVLLAS